MYLPDPRKQHTRPTHNGAKPTVDEKNNSFDSNLEENKNMGKKKFDKKSTTGTVVVAVAAVTAAGTTAGASLGGKEKHMEKFALIIVGDL